MKPSLFFAAIVATFIVGFAVGRVSAPSVDTSAPAPFAERPATPPPSAMPPMGAAPAGSSVEGTVLEVIQVPNYTYLRLKTAAGDQWGAVPSTESVREGQQVRLTNAMEMQGFASKTLGRTFDSIWFAQLDGAPEAVAGGAPSLPPGHPPMAGTPPSPAAGALAAVEQAGPALTLRVADVFSERQALAGQKVRVSGVAGKVTAIQGAWYVHLKDGSGTAGKDDDLMVIATSEVKPEARVMLEGRVTLDKDVGMGSTYPVVIENATVLGH